MVILPDYKVLDARLKYLTRQQVLAMQLRKQPLVRHQVDVWGWSLKQW